MSYKHGGYRRKYFIQKIIDCPCCDNGRSTSGYPCPHCGCKGKVLRDIDRGANYFVLRLDTDPHARKAALAYADSVEVDNKRFADELRFAVQIAENPR